MIEVNSQDAKLDFQAQGYSEGRFAEGEGVIFESRNAL